MLPQHWSHQNNCFQTMDHNPYRVVHLLSIFVFGAAWKHLVYKWVRNRKKVDSYSIRSSSGDVFYQHFFFQHSLSHLSFLFNIFVFATECQSSPKSLVFHWLSNNAYIRRHLLRSHSPLPFHVPIFNIPWSTKNFPYWLCLFRTFLLYKLSVNVNKNNLGLRDQL